MCSKVSRSCLVLLCTLLLFLLVSSSCVRAQGSTEPVSLDVRPLVVQLRAIGWLPSVPTGVYVAGTIVHLPQTAGEPETIRIWAYDSSRFRLEIDRPDGIAATTVSGLRRVRHLAGKGPVLMPLREEGAAQGWMLPWLLLPKLLASSDLSAIRTGVIGQTPATGYEFLPRRREDSPIARAQEVHPVTLWMSTDGIPLQIDFFIQSDTNRYAGVHASRMFIGTAMQQGVLVPAKEELTIGSTPSSELTLSSVTISSQVDDSHFEEARVRSK